MDELVAARRATRWRVGAGATLWVAAERLRLVAALHPDGAADPPIEPPRDARVPDSFESAAEELIGARLESLGPVTVSEVATSLGLPERTVATALVGLESRGVVMRGRFTPDRGAAGVEEWCDRRVLARIHRATLERLRREIEPVTGQQYLRFLARWQRVEPGERMEGAAAVATVLEQLEGFETPAAAWESELLPARVEDYDPVWLDALCLAGRWVWGRAVPPDESDRPASRPIRTSPIALLPRDRADVWRAAGPARDGDGPRSAHARAVLDAMVAGGASFFGDLVRRTGLLRTRVEEALGELVAAGLATADSFTGLRALLVPSDRRPGREGGRRRVRPVFGIEDAGRWALLPTPAARGEERFEIAARALLRRYGVVFRGILERESLAPPWRDLLPVLRRLEARGELRGGRFVDGFAGEQFALPEAVPALRKVRREEPRGAWLSISAADPLNLLGIVVPGPRVAATPSNRILYRDGLPVAVLEAGEVRFLVEDLDAAERWQAASALQRRRIPPALRAYLGRSA